MPLDDYDFFVVAFEDKDGNTIHRQDMDADAVKALKNDPDGYGKIWREFSTQVKPTKWVVWPHSISQDWCERLEGHLP
jgi:hypothetical protein